MPAPSAPLATRATILLVEEDPAMVLLLKDRLESQGYRLCCAGSAIEAEHLLAGVRPDLVILDVMLPDANALVLCADVKAALGVPVILCSATRRRDDSVLGFKLGADDFVAKPFSVDELKARVELALRRASPAEAPPGAASPSPPPRSIGTLVLDHARCRALLGDQVLRLPRPSTTCCVPWPSGPARSSPTRNSPSACGATTIRGSGAPWRSTCDASGPSSTAVARRPPRW